MFAAAVPVPVPARGCLGRGAGGFRAGRRRERTISVLTGIDRTAVQRQLLADEEQTAEQIALLDERGREAQLPGEVAFSSEATLADEAPLAVEREKELALRRSLQSRLLDVRHALQKIDQGSYGRCDSCGQEISEQRLRAQPQSALCITCKAKAERAR
jgi:RNA polymerase-binding transcription factor DksA